VVVGDECVLEEILVVLPFPTPERRAETGVHVWLMPVSPSHTVSGIAAMCSSMIAA
jgi:hypothetical protein